MADLDFIRNVPDVPATTGPAVPAAYRRTEKVQPVGTPDLQGALTKYAENSNWMSAVGASVASKASDAIASQIGGNLGKNPQGNIGISLTEFDKTMEQSYKTQAQATLGLQADKLITESNITAASASRMTPELIRSTQDSISAGLKKIYANAPSDILPNLSKVYGAAQLNQMEHLTNRMLNEQHEDRKNTTILSNNQNAETAHALAASGNYAQAETVIKTNDAMNKSTIEGNVGFSPQQGKVGSDTVRQSAISGRLQYEYQQKVKEGKGDEYLKDVANRPKWISDADYPAAIQNLSSYVSHQNALKSNYEQLTMSDFKTRMVTDIGAITGTELQSALDKLSPINASKLNLEYANAYKTYKKDSLDQNVLSQHWEDPTVQANAPEKIKNNTFNGKVDYVMKSNPNTSREDAESKVAASAGGAIPVFTSTLKNKLWSGDANQMVSSAKQIDKLQSDGNGHALTGLNEQDLAIASDIKHNYNPADPASAARIITQNKLNQDATFRKESEATFANMIFDNTRKNNTTTDDYILKTFGMQGGLFHSGFDSPWAKSGYASDILSNYRTNFLNSGRDNDRAITMTKEYIANNYGKTSINGGSEWTLHPIEIACGFGEGEGLHTINSDIMRQIQEPMAIQKKAYEDKLTDEYWAIEPSLREKSHKSDIFNLQLPASGTLIGGLNSKKQTEIERLNFVKHTREGVATKTETYPLRLVGNNFNWELNVETAHGPRSIFLEAPTIGVHTYTPDLKWIEDHPNG